MEKSADSKDDDLQDLWMVRACEIYLDEYKDCGTSSARWHQKYTTGEKTDCSKWKEMYDLCMKYRDTRDHEAVKELIDREQAARNKRLDGARGNNVWVYRKSPPEDWAKPLPDGLEKMKLPEIKDSPGCVIL